MPLLRFFCYSVLSFMALCGAAAEDGSFAIGTFNIRGPENPSPNTWQERAERCITVIERNSLDIFGTQEANRAQLEDLTANGRYKFIGSGRNDFKAAGEHSAILYRPERFELLADGTFGLSEKPHVPGYISWDSACPRIATWGHFRDRETGRDFIFYNTHLDHISGAARHNGILLIMEHIRQNAEGKPVILTGDFNEHPRGKAYSAAAAMLKETGNVLAPGSPFLTRATYNGFGNSDTDHPIDFIFVSGDFRVLEHKVDDTPVGGQYASDHYLVTARVAI